MKNAFKCFLLIGAAASAATAPAAGTQDYIQAGLVANWDGLNKGDTSVGSDGYAHWRDLVGNYDIAITNPVASAYGYDFINRSGDKANDYRHGTISQADTRAVFGASTEKTVEIVLSCPPNGSRAALLTSRNMTNPTGVAFMINDSNGLTAHSGYKKGPYYDTSTFSSSATNTYTVVYTNNYPKAIYCSGSAVPVNGAAPNFWALNGIDSCGAYVGCGLLYTDAARLGKHAYVLGGPILAIRSYGRILDEGEILCNALVDRVRFLGDDGFSALTVAATIDGVAATRVPVSPAYGTRYVTAGDAETFFITGAVSNYVDGVRAFHAGDGSRVFFRDATVAVGDGAPTVRNNESFDLTYAASWTKVTWNFTNLQHLAVASVANPQLGTVSVTSLWVTAGEELDIVATPSAGCRFSKWSGDVDGVADVTNPHLTVAMNAPRTLVAEFAVAPYPGETYPTDYRFLLGLPAEPAPAVGASAADELEARYRTIGDFGVGNFDPNKRPAMMLLVR